MKRKLTTLFVLLLTVLAVRAQSAAQVPGDATIEDDWVCSFVMHSTGGDETVSEAMKVAFSGDDVYFHLPNPIAGNTWVKGTIGQGTATFAKGQYLGSFGGSVYMVGQNADGICDVVFGYDADKSLFTLSDMQVVLSSSATKIDAWAYYTGVTVQKQGAVSGGDSWTFTYTMNYMDNNGQQQVEKGQDPIDVVIDGSDVTFTLPNPLNGSAVVKGTIEGGKATFKQGQQLGTFQNEPFYLAGLAGSGLCDVVFNYDSANQTFTLADMYLLINSSLTEALPWCFFTSVVIAKGTAVVPGQDELVQLPDGLTMQDYAFTAKSVIYDMEGSIDHFEDVARPVKVAFNGDTEVYVRGLCEEFPMSWVKGVIGTDAWDTKTVTFAGGQYFGDYHSLPLYFVGKSYGVLGDVMFDLDGTDLIHKSMVYINTSKTQEAPLDVYANADIKRIALKAATPANPVIERYQPFNQSEGYAAIMLTIPATDVNGNVIATGHLAYRFFTEKNGQQQPYIFTRSKYTDLTEAEQTDMPYDFATGYNFFMGGSLVYLNDNLEANDRLGVQSVYTVSGTERTSDIVWMPFGNSDGIAAPAATVRVEGETLTDMQGRPATASTRGLLIQTQRMADGTVRTKKIVR